MRNHRVLFLFVLLMIISCKTEETFIDPVPVETPELKTAITSIQNAFKNSDTAQIRTLILPNYFPRYRKVLQTNAEKLYDFSKLLDDFELVAGDSIYMVYKVQYKKVQHEITFSKDEKGKWKLMNF